MHPILFHIGPASSGFTVHTFGLLLVIAFVAGILRALSAARRREAVTGISPDNLLDTAVWTIIIGIIGARLAFVLIGWDDFKSQPWTIFQIWQGGISFHGGLFAGLAALIYCCRKRSLNVLEMSDLFAPSVMLSYAIGRIGCFFNGCCYGAPTTMPWAVRFDDNGVWTAPSHPTQIYSSLMSFAFFGLLVRMERHRTFRGQLASIYLMLAATERFIMEIWRAGITSSGGAFGLTEVQILCIGIFALGSVGAIVLPRCSRNRAATAAIAGAQ